MCSISGRACGIALAVNDEVPVLLLLLAFVSTGCIASRSGGVLFPTQSEVGLVTMTDGKVGDSGVRYSSELSWASLSPDAKTPVDVGVGYHVDRFTPTDKPLKHGSVEIPTVFHGPTLSFSSRIGGSEHLRKWIGARLEMPMRHMGANTYLGLGASLRASAELFTTVSSDNAMGAFGLGTYVEGGVRKIPGGDAAFVMSSGLSLRLPFAVAN